MCFILRVKQVALFINVIFLIFSSKSSYSEDIKTYLLGTNIYDIKIDKEGDIFVTGRANPHINGLFRISGDVIDTFLRKDANSYIAYAYTLFCDSQNRIWICDDLYEEGGNKEDLTIFNDKNTLDRSDDEWINITKETMLIKDTHIFGINEDFAGRIWLGLRNARYITGGVDILTLDLKKSWHFDVSNSGLPQEFVISICPSPDGKSCWIGTESAGLVKFYFGESLNDSSDFYWTVFNTDNSPLLNNSIQELMFDDNGNLWIATFNGVNLFDTENKWRKFESNLSSIVHPNVYDIAIDPDGFVWCATGGGLTQLNPRTGRSANNYSISTGLPSNEVKCIEINKRNGDIWAGTSLGLVQIYNREVNFGKFNVLFYPNPFKYNLHSEITFGNIPGNAEIFIFDISGSLVSKLQNSLIRPDGIVKWAPVNLSGEKLSPGIYPFSVVLKDGRINKGIITIIP